MSRDFKKTNISFSWDNLLYDFEVYVTLYLEIKNVHLANFKISNKITCNVFVWNILSNTDRKLEVKFSLLSFGII